MNTSSDKKDSSYLLPELCLMAEMSVRTVRYYMQIGLVSKPEGGTRAARYGAQHLEQLLLIKKWSSAGVSLERIRELLHGAPAPLEVKLQQIGSISVCTHLTVAHGVELVIDAGKAGWTPEQLREFVRQAIALAESMKTSLDA
ncbi:MerR family transcriptional regulator [Undibacterium sp. Di27W]|uniref:MerR family transcriptional regulator n=1 Tax=Undibacterium sp. Di27W TaxID=3413036 RepID=UPI003BF1CAAC